MQLLRTYPNLRHGRDFPFARGGERSVARGYTKAIGRASGLVYVEDQYFWGHDVADPFLTALRDRPELRLVVVIPLVPDVDGLAEVPELLGRNRAFHAVMSVAPGRVAAYGIENHAGTPVYVHAKVCVIDDVWASVGSDNFNRRSWTHDSELSCVVLDEEYARSLRLTLAAEHLDRLGDVEAHGLVKAMADCLEPSGHFDAYAASADRLDAWHAGVGWESGHPGRSTVATARAQPVPASVGQGAARGAARPRRASRPAARRAGLLRAGLRPEAQLNAFSPVTPGRRPACAPRWCPVSQDALEVCRVPDSGCNLTRSRSRRGWSGPPGRWPATCGRC